MHQKTSPGRRSSATRPVSASATTAVGGNGFYTWTNAALASDLQGWLAAPATNYGWILLGDEVQLGAARKLVNRENPDPALRPVLTIEFTPPSYPDTVVPILSGPGLAILVLLMLGAGFVGLGVRSSNDIYIK